jgi:hypothetical protein
MLIGFPQKVSVHIWTEFECQFQLLLLIAKKMFVFTHKYPTVKVHKIYTRKLLEYLKYL